MWKKSEESKGVEEPARPGPARTTGSPEPAVIGRGIIIKGDITGNQDLLIRGQVDGTIKLPENEVTIGRDGRVNATIEARSISIEGAVEGDLKGVEQIIVKSSGDVTGNISAPRVGLEDGALFKGRIDMEPGPAPQTEFKSLGDDSKTVAGDKKQQPIPGTGSA